MEDDDEITLIPGTVGWESARAERAEACEAELRKSLTDVLALARIKWDRDPEATIVFERAETLLRGGT